LTLPESITKLESLQALKLNDNKLKTLPESIGNLKSLKNFYLKENPLKKKTNIILKQLERSGVSVSK